MFALFLFALSAHAIRIPFTVNTLNLNSLHKRSPTDISNAANVQYVSNITLGGVTIPVLLDTGSSDLWGYFPQAQPSLTDLGESVSLGYALGKVNGGVAVTTVDFGGYKIDNQAFLHVADTSTFTTDISAQGYYGLLGLGPNAGSQVRKKIKNDSRGNTLLTHIFESHNMVDNYITFLLDRKGDPADPFKGQLTISETVPGFENITSMPKIDIDKVNRLLKADQHWQIMTDKDNGIIGPDGKPLQVDSIVPGCPDGQLVAVIDSGFTFSQVPRDISDQLYGRVKGAYYDTKEEFWMIPCDQALNVTFSFGGQSYPVHPLDTVDDNFKRVDPTGKKICYGAFQPITSAFSLLGHYDMILGMSFLRNAYTLLDFGNWIDADKQKSDHPYVQLASVTNADVAHREFVQTRLGGVDTTGDQKYQLLPADQMVHSPVSDEEKKKKYQEMILSRWPYIVTGCLVGLCILIGLCVWKFCCCCRKNQNKKESNRSRMGDGIFGKGDEFDRHNSAKLEEASAYGEGKNNHSMYSLNRVPTNQSQDPRHQPNVSVYSHNPNPFATTSQVNVTNSNSNLIGTNSQLNVSNASGQWDNSSPYSPPHYQQPQSPHQQYPPSPSQVPLQYPSNTYAGHPHSPGYDNTGYAR